MLAVALASIAGFMAVFVMAGTVQVARQAIGITRVAIATMRDPALGDTQREAEVQQASIRLFRNFFGILLRVLAALIAGLLPLLIVDWAGWIAFGDSVDFLSRWDVIAAATVAICVLWYGVHLLRRTGSDGYSLADRIIHRIALSGNAVPEVVHDLERSRFLSKAPADRAGRHVFVCGLARAGTTVLTRDLHTTGEFGSLTYRDMPFVLAPNLFAGLTAGSRLDKIERAHGDGLAVDLDSPEALDEVFWRVKTGRDFIRDDRLVPHTPDAGTLTGYADFVRLILLKSGKSRYLSKSNNTVLRLPELTQHFPEALFLIPVRSPQQQSQSLLRQHARFTGIPKFHREYMGWLAHHEFGDAHRPIVFRTPPHGSTDDIGYWMQIWVDVYGALAEIEEKLSNVFFVSYEDLCASEAYRGDLMRRLDLNGHQFTELRQVASALPAEVDAELADKASALYDELRMRATKAVSQG